MNFSKFPIYWAVLAVQVSVTLTTKLVPVSSGSCGKKNVSMVQIVEEHPAVTNLRTYLRIVTVHPDPQPGYRKAIQWLKGLAREVDLEFSEVDLGPMHNGNTVGIMTWKGRNPALSSVMFDSHMDVVAAEPVKQSSNPKEKWKYPPFAACKDEEGNIFGRGTVDNKANTVAVLEAIRRLKQDGFKPLRTIHVTVVPDEEKGGLHGMKPFVQTDYFQRMNVGLVIDECGGNWWDDTMRVCHAEKSSWQFNITTRGEPGHGAWFPEYTAGHRMLIVLSKFFDFRREQYDKWQSTGVFLDKITTINLTGMGGGTASNVIAGELWASFDMRIRQSTNWTFTEVEAFINNVMDSARVGTTDEDDVSIEYILQTLETGETAVNDSNVWWTVVQESCRELDIYCPSSVVNAFTDARHLRNLGIPVFGMAPFLNTPGTAHKHNEFINEVEFLRGIERYVVFIRSLSLTAPFTDDSSAR